MFSLCYDRGAKEMPIETPGETSFRLTVDTDDVDIYEVACLLKKALTILNDNWNDPRYAHLGIVGAVSDELGDNARDAEWDRRYDAGNQLMARLGRTTGNA